MPRTAIEQFVGENLANEDRPKTTFLLVKPYQESRIRLLAGWLLALRYGVGACRNLVTCATLRVSVVAHMRVFWGTLKRIPSMGQD
jgi:hypothetical protein